jgi:cardiolipin synthase
MNHSIRDAVSIFTAVVFVCVVLLLSIVIWSIRRHRDPKLHIECDSPIDELIPSLAGLTLSTAVAGNSVEVLENGAFFEVLLQRIRSAQQSVHFETFLWKERVLGQRVADACLTRRSTGLPQESASAGYLHVRPL